MPYLTGPVNTLTDMQVEYAGLLMGQGTPYDLPAPWTFLDLPPVKTMDQARTWADGSWSGPDFADVFLPQTPVEITPSPGMTFGQAVQAFLRAFTIQQAPQPLWVKLPGLPVQGIGAKVGQRSIPIDLSFGLGVMAAGCMVQWRCPNPVWQTVPRTSSLNPGTALAALEYPLFATWAGGTGVLDFDVTAAGPSSAVLINGGNTPAWPLVTIFGPNNGWQVAVDGHVVASTTPVAAGAVLTVDWATGRAMLAAGGGGAADRTYQLTSRDFAPVPTGGQSTVVLTTSGGNATVTTADLWR